MFTMLLDTSISLLSVPYNLHISCLVSHYGTWQRCTQVSNVKSQVFQVKSQVKSQVFYVKSQVKSQVATHIKLFAMFEAFIQELCDANLHNFYRATPIPYDELR